MGRRRDQQKHTFYRYGNKISLLQVKYQAVNIFAALLSWLTLCIGMKCQTWAHSRYRCRPSFQFGGSRFVVSLHFRFPLHIWVECMLRLYRSVWDGGQIVHFRCFVPGAVGTDRHQCWPFALWLCFRSSRPRICIFVWGYE